MTSLEFNGNDLTDERLRSLEHEPGLEQLVIWSGPFTNERLAPLSRLRDLKGLMLGDMPIDDGVLEHLRPLRKLEYINLPYTAVRGTFEILEGLPLRDVRLEACRNVGDDAVRSLARFPGLRQLEIHMTGLTDAGLAHLRDWPMEVLWLGPRITDKGMSTIGSMHTLRHLDLSAPGVSDSGAAELDGLSTIEVLWLTGTRITDRSVEMLSQLSSLRELNVHRSGVTEAGVARLREALPGCTVNPAAAS